jgi:hypothetical protein
LSTPRRGVFDALGDRLLLERVGDLDNRLDHLLVGLVGHKIAYGLQVDLQVAGVDVLEVGKRAEARAEVIEREVAADAVEPTPEQLGFLEVGRCRGASASISEAPPPLRLLRSAGMADWVTISSLATAGGTLVLAVATFSSVKSGNRAARVAERSLLVGQHPVLIPSREDDPVERVRFGDGVFLTVPGHGAALELASANIYLAIALRNGGSGLAVIHGWRAEASEHTGSVALDLGDFRRQQRDLYIPAGYTGFWQGAIRDHGEPSYDGLRAAVETGARVQADLLYGDHEGGQRTIARFAVSQQPDGDGERAEVLRYWNVDQPNPR